MIGNETVIVEIFGTRETFVSHETGEMIIGLTNVVTGARTIVIPIFVTQIVERIFHQSQAGDHRQSRRRFLRGLNRGLRCHRSLRMQTRSIIENLGMSPSLALVLTAKSSRAFTSTPSVKLL